MDSAEKTTGTAVGTRDRILDIVVEILDAARRSAATGQTSIIFTAG